MSPVRHVIVAAVVVTSAIAILAAVATGTLQRVFGGDSETTAGVTPATTAPDGGPPPPDSAPTGPTSPTRSGDAPSGPPAAPGDAPVFDTAVVSLTDDDGGAAIFTLANVAPGAGDTGCITVTYTGDSAAAVRLYGTTGGSGLSDYLGLTVTRGSFPSGAPGFDSCAGFVADAANYLGAGGGVVYSGTLAQYPDSYDAGVEDPPGTPEAWTDAETHAYRFAVSVADDNAAQGLDASQTFVWEARGEEPPTQSGPVPVVDPRSGGPGAVVTVGSGSDACIPPAGTVNPTARVWISAPDGSVLHEVFLPVAPDGSWSGTIAIPETAASFDFVDLWASCSAEGEGSAETFAAAAAPPPYYFYSAVRFTVERAPTPGPASPAEPASAVLTQPTFVG